MTSTRALTGSRDGPKCGDIVHLNFSYFLKFWKTISDERFLTAVRTFIKQVSRESSGIDEFNVLILDSLQERASWRGGQLNKRSQRQ